VRKVRERPPEDAHREEYAGVVKALAAVRAYRSAEVPPRRPRARPAADHAIKSDECQNRSRVTRVHASRHAAVAHGGALTAFGCEPRRPGGRARRATRQRRTRWSSSAFGPPWCTPPAPAARPAARQTTAAQPQTAQTTARPQTAQTTARAAARQTAARATALDWVARRPGVRPRRARAGVPGAGARRARPAPPRGCARQDRGGPRPRACLVRHRSLPFRSAAQAARCAKTSRAWPQPGSGRATAAGSA
jgi:hypothetical protein